MTEFQRKLIDKKDEDGLRSMISNIMATKLDDKDSIIEYCETRLESLNVDAAMVEMSEVKVGEV